MTVKSDNAVLRAPRRERLGGFTLIELMIAVAVIGILAAIAYPSYQQYVRKARRADGQEALVRLQVEQEKWRTNNTSYTGTLGDLGMNSSSADGYYTIAITANSGTGFTATATGQGTQASDTGCTPLTITTTARLPTECW